MVYKFRPRGVCTREMTVEAENGKIKSARLEGGCAGNTAGVASLIRGMDLREARDRLKGIQCGTKGTSCPDQLAVFLDEIIEKEGV